MKAISVLNSGDVNSGGFFMPNASCPKRAGSAVVDHRRHRNASNAGGRALSYASAGLLTLLGSLTFYCHR